MVARGIPYSRVEFIPVFHGGLLGVLLGVAVLGRCLVCGFGFIQSVVILSTLIGYGYFSFSVVSIVIHRNEFIVSSNPRLMLFVVVSNALHTHYLG